MILICYRYYTGWIWLVVWNIFLFFHILGRIIPTDFHIFQRGRSTANQIYIYIYTDERYLWFIDFLIGFGHHPWRTGMKIAFLQRFPSALKKIPDEGNPIIDLEGLAYGETHMVPYVAIVPRNGLYYKPGQL